MPGILHHDAGHTWAAGIGGTPALGLITEVIGMGLPPIAAPAVNSAQAAHPAFERNVDALRSAGVAMLHGPGIWEPAPPRSGGAPFDAELALTALAQARDRLGSR